MALGPRLDLRQGQSLVMTPRLQQSIRLLALSNLEVEAYLADALAANPLLEIAEAEDSGAVPDADLASEAPPLTDEGTGLDRLLTQSAPADHPFDQDFGNERDWSEGAPAAATDRSAERGEDAAWREPPGSGTTLAEHLHAQLGASSRDPELSSIGHVLIDHLDEAGYLTVDLDEVARSLSVPLAAVAEALALVQSLEPTGVGARDLGECLALQAREADRLDPCMARLLAHLDLVARGLLAQTKRLCGVDDEDLGEMLAELRGYDPRPGLRFGATPVITVEPDVLVREAPGGWEVTINPRTLPRLVVNRSYYTQVRGGCPDRAERGWLQEKLADANWLVKALDQRQQTMLKVAAEIVRHQDEFLRRGIACLRPLTLRKVAEAIGMHESTVSRAVANKYLSCPRGTFELKSFFTSSVGSASGDEAASAEAVKAAIRKLIAAEQPQAVLSDDALVERLRQQGFDLARRTVAKYREAIGLGSSVQRRRQLALAAAAR